jgi:hypothetical protein
MSDLDMTLSTRSDVGEHLKLRMSAIKPELILSSNWGFPISADIGQCQQCIILIGHFECRMSTGVGPCCRAIPGSSVVENESLADTISLVVIQAKKSCFKQISKYFRFSGRYIGFLEGNKCSLKAPSCRQFIFRKSRQGAFTNSKWFRNGCKKSGLGAI